jgi:hypothetical protein
VPLCHSTGSPATLFTALATSSGTRAGPAQVGSQLHLIVGRCRTLALRGTVLPQNPADPLWFMNRPEATSLMPQVAIGADGNADAVAVRSANSTGCSSAICPEAKPSRICSIGRIRMESGANRKCAGPSPH